MVRKEAAQIFCPAAFCENTFPRREFFSQTHTTLHRRYQNCAEGKERKMMAEELAQMQKIVLIQTRLFLENWCCWDEWNNISSFIQVFSSAKSFVLSVVCVNLVTMPFICRHASGQIFH